MDSDFGIPRELSDLQKHRSLYEPVLPPCLQVLFSVHLSYLYLSQVLLFFNMRYLGNFTTLRSLFFYLGNTRFHSHSICWNAEQTVLLDLSASCWFSSYHLSLGLVFFCSFLFQIWILLLCIHPHSNRLEVAQSCKRACASLDLAFKLRGEFVNSGSSLDLWISPGAPFLSLCLHFLPFYMLIDACKLRK